MTAKEFLDSTFNTPTVENSHSDWIYSENEVLRLMKAYAKHCCDKQKEICAENAITETDTSTSFVYTSVNKDSILNSPYPEELC